MAESTKRCTLLGWEGLVLQALLGALALSVLLIKRCLENPKRPYRVFLLDTAKQACGLGSIHVLNLLISFILAAGSNPCVWYFWTQTGGLIVGTPLSYILLRWSTDYLVSKGVQAVAMSGNYGTPPQWRVWAKQVLHWMSVIAVQRTLLGLLLRVFKSPLNNSGNKIFEHMSNTDSLLFAVIFWPPITGIVEFWIQDNFLKEGGKFYCCNRSQLRMVRGAFGVQGLDLDDDPPLLPHKAESPESGGSSSGGSTPSPQRFLLRLSDDEEEELARGLGIGRRDGDFLTEELEQLDEGVQEERGESEGRSFHNTV